MEAGALGTESRDAGDGAHIIGYYDAPVEESEIRTALLDCVRHLQFRSFITNRSESQRKLPIATGWPNGRKNWQPVAVGGRFIVAPPWSDVTARRIASSFASKPGMAFGTGTHETTRLCLKAIEKYYRGGQLSGCRVTGYRNPGNRGGEDVSGCARGGVDTDADGRRDRAR